MIKNFILERFSWIACYLFFHLFILFVAYVDSAIPFPPVLYMVFLSFIMFCIFLTVRYKKETKFYRSLAEQDDNLDLSNIADPESPFERIIERSISNQIDYLKHTASQGQMTLEQEKDELLAWIHEVKTPLTALHLMMDRIQDEELKSHMTYEWLRIHLLLDQQLHQRRLPFMENDLYIGHTDLESIIFDEIKTLQSWCIQKGIGFDIDLEKAECLSDSKWIAFIIRQLLTNSIKYSEGSDILVQSHESNGQTILEVKDAGRGIDPRDLPRIFDKGFTSTINHQDHGATGMGLYLTKKVADSLLIDITVQSTLGEGTTFTLTFPKRNQFVKFLSM
ncbi:sensor histidine kinase [Peribacillus sp. NPDC097295]|uniref:sensor histidine kinase n=1 Tax=Peribacillus sp. NPDC097295 TaxID=3364402 RepID=UPI003811AFD0